MFLGGTWERYAPGRTLVGVNANDPDFNAAGKTGGEKKHTLTVEELADHKHIVPDIHGATGAGTTNFPEYTMKITTCVEKGETFQAWQRFTGEVRRNASTQPHNNMPPYTTCYMWVRTA